MTIVPRPLLILSCLCLLISGCVAEKAAISSDVAIKSNNTRTAASGYMQLSELTDRFATELASEVVERNIYLDRANIRYVNTRDVANLSSYLQNDMEASLSQAGFNLQIMPTEADLLLGATFQKYGEQLKIFFKYHSLDYSVNKTKDYSIKRERLPEDSLEENLNSKAYQLAANIIDDDLERKIYIKPLESSSCDCVGQFSRFFTNLLKADIVQMHRQVVVIDEKPVKKKLSNTRALERKVREVENLETSDAYFAGADSVLEGNYAVNGDQVLISLFLKGLNGQILGSTTVDVAREIIKMPLEDKTASEFSELTDRKNENSGGKIKLSTSRGGDSPVFYNEEVIQFYVHTREPLFTYLYTIDSKKEVTLLYPLDGRNGRNRIYPGSLVTVPGPDDDYELVAEAPFGMDAVKVFASMTELPIPTLNRSVATRSYTRGSRAIGVHRQNAQQQLATQSVINPDDLVDYYKGLGERFGINIYEDSFVVETRR